MAPRTALYLAILLALSFWVVAPIMGQARDWFFVTLGASALRVLAMSFGALAVVLVIGAGGKLVKIREHRGLRYSALAAALLLVWIQAAGFSTSDLKVDVVEKMHIVQYGLLAFLLYRAFLPRGDLSVPLLAWIWAAFAGLGDEAVQWFFQERVGEIRDVALNAAAATAGVCFAVSWNSQVLRLNLPRPSLLAVSRCFAFLCLALALFIHNAHLGQVIEDPEIGRFRSYFDVEELKQLQEERRQRWSVKPITELDPLAKEDYFLTEASSHAQHRNERLQAGNHYMAWQANLILERYYSPFLDLESFRGTGRHRWPDSLREEVRSKAEAQRPAQYVLRYLSPVHEGRIWEMPSRGPYLALVGLLLLLLGWLWFWPALADRTAGLFHEREP